MAEIAPPPHFVSFRFILFIRMIHAGLLSDAEYGLMG